MREDFTSEDGYEPFYGYSRMVRVADALYVSGHVSSIPDPATTSAYDQAVSAIEALRTTLAEAGAELRHVVRTVAYITSIDDVDDIARAHREAFGTHRPAATCVVVTSLVVPDLKVEIQADAVLFP